MTLRLASLITVRLVLWFSHVRVSLLVVISPFEMAPEGRAAALCPWAPGENTCVGQASFGCGRQCRRGPHQGADDMGIFTQKHIRRGDAGTG